MLAEHHVFNIPYFIQRIWSPEMVFTVTSYPPENVVDKSHWRAEVLGFAVHEVAFVAVLDLYKPIVSIKLKLISPGA